MTFLITSATHILGALVIAMLPIALGAMWLLQPFRFTSRSIAFSGVVVELSARKLATITLNMTFVLAE